MSDTPESITPDAPDAPADEGVFAARHAVRVSGLILKISANQKRITEALATQAEALVRLAEASEHMHRNLAELGTVLGVTHTQED